MFKKGDVVEFPYTLTDGRVVQMHGRVTAIGYTAMPISDGVPSSLHVTSIRPADPHKVLSHTVYGVSNLQGGKQNRDVVVLHLKSVPVTLVS